jgi:hypothetical protein
MSTEIYWKFKDVLFDHCLTRRGRLDTLPFTVALVDNYHPRRFHARWSKISQHETTMANYAPQELAISTEVSANNKLLVFFDDVVFEALGPGRISHAIVHTEGLLVACVDMGLVTDGGDVILKWMQPALLIDDASWFFIEGLVTRLFGG